MRKWDWSGADRWKRRLKRLAIVLTACFLGFLLLDMVFPLPEGKPYSRIVEARDGSMLQAYLAEDDKWRMHTRIAEVPDELVAALVAKEDRWYWWHAGVNPLALGRAMLSNVGAGERVSGASTITMQVARMLEPKPRTFWGKLVEMFRAFQLEWHHSKEEILEMYLSYLPYGGNVEGVKAASYIYFERPPQQLSLSQSIQLTVIPNRPNSLRPDLHAGALKAAHDKWARRFRDEGIFDGPALADALAEPIVATRHELEGKAPQFCYSLRNRASDAVIRTTLSPPIQAQTERLLANHVRRVRSQGITNGAVLVVDNATGEVLAYCGSADFADKAAFGEVDAVQAVRSPGSTLKPLLYAAAFDQGLLTPKMRVLDVPFEAGGYLPDNYDRTCTGEVSVEYALRHSLNLPAVRTLHALGLHNFLTGLEMAGFEGIATHKRDMGLSVALGGCGVSLVELVRAYRALANGGRLLPLRSILDGADAGADGVQICSPQAAYLVTEILSGLERPDLPMGLVERTQLPKVAWKTGTSFGRRDAWSVGYSPRYTIGVWMGNMDGSPVAGISGAATATPLLIDLFNALDANPEKTWFAMPKGLERRKVCASTGLIPGPHCPHMHMDLRIVGRSPLRTCTHLKEVFVNETSAVRYCKACLPPSGFRRTLYEDYHPELLDWMVRKGIQPVIPPPHNPHCTAVFDGKGPQIVSPKPDGEYFVEEGQELVLRAAGGAETSQVYWFANDQFLGSSTAEGKLAFTPTEGMVEIACMDDKGRMTEIAVQVRYF